MKCWSLIVTPSGSGKADATLPVFYQKRDLFLNILVLAVERDPKFTPKELLECIKELERLGKCSLPDGTVIHYLPREYSLGPLEIAKIDAVVVADRAKLSKLKSHHEVVQFISKLR